MRKTTTVVSKSGSIWYRYDAEKYRQDHLKYYTESNAYKKCRHIFLKNLMTSKHQPHNKSLLKYRPTDEELDKVVNQRVCENPDIEDDIRSHYTNIKNQRDSVLSHSTSKRSGVSP